MTSLLCQDGVVTSFWRDHYVASTVYIWAWIPGRLMDCWFTFHDDVIKWKHFSRNWPFVWGIHRSSVNCPHKGQWRGAFKFSLICNWINGWVNNRQAGDLRRYRAHYDVIGMPFTDHNRVDASIIRRWKQYLVSTHQRPEKLNATTNIFLFLFFFVSFWFKQSATSIYNQAHPNTLHWGVTGDRRADLGKKTCQWVDCVNALPWMHCRGCAAWMHCLDVMMT